jgi:hypothetical protein
MTKATSGDGFFSPSLSKQDIILILALLALTLSYVSAVADPNAPLDWDVGCCGRSFWWSPIGCALVLVGAAVIFRIRSRWSWISAALLSVYVCYYSLYEALENWNYYYSLDKLEALRAALLPIYRPLSLFPGLFIFVEALRNLVLTSGRTRSLPDA